MPFMWDYDINKLRKTKYGKLLILERMLNYGPDEGEKIKLSEVKKNWNKLNLFPSRKRFFEFLIRGK